ncbi:hypothetical protein GCM10009133_15590 [Cocleimonas flava]|uniref:Cytochrome oxidase Cu insertion factor (SCO1/SenC/PrrC family) n=1 Tax=Cocleimonas flava TaxID=634765 RepID=A0A4R1ESE7_9GAMM|nr:MULTISPECIES: hypothetical protein [Cocleimonas]MEB8434237.1 hypothetical protein [Cocleimonas sp. KMM 6892]MEC4717144.1 hypothetical protein [Cocleimonas sp. KMM 6895]MEC4746509.1 hypothetical protein [Cocleimonas sp. KMM 6896]TCJ84487.1 hypothetical protein EV695_2444 [Cocleimonas flava]
MDSGKKSFLWLVTIFVAPILLGTLLFFNLERLGFEKGSVNYGNLVQPAQPTKVEDLKQAGAPAVLEDVITKKWTMLYIENGKCEEFCQARLRTIKRVRLLMNEQMRRVRTVLVSSDDVLKSISSKDNPDLVLTEAMPDSEFLKQFPEQQQEPIYLIDPFGNLMMYYPQENPDLKKMIKDIRRLLKYSHLG